MGFVVSKLLPMVVYPLGLSILLIVCAIFLSRRKYLNSAVVLLGFSAGILWVCSTPVFSDYIRASLEHDFPVVPIKELPSSDAIVILGGGTGNISSMGVVNMQSATDRVFHGLRLFKAGKAPYIILTGGGAPGDIPEADVMAILLKEFGVPEQFILLETQSANSRQNAINTLKIIEEHKMDHVLLVTSVSHMKRALGVFQRLDIQVTPAATDYEVKRPNLSTLDWFPDAGALAGTTDSIKEYIALIVYQLRGWISY